MEFLQRLFDKLDWAFAGLLGAIAASFWHRDDLVDRKAWAIFIFSGAVEVENKRLINEKLRRELNGEEEGPPPQRIEVVVTDAVVGLLMCITLRSRCGPARAGKLRNAIVRYYRAHNFAKKNY